MILRPYQKKAVEKCVSALNDRKNTLLVAPTGAGKTIMISGVNRDVLMDHGAERALILQHRDELTSQNLDKFRKFTENKISMSIFDAKTKSFRGRATFGMVQTLARNLDRIPKLDMISIDEAHHAPASSYQNIIKAARDKNPDIKIFGVTATPVRGDKKTLRGTFDNVADQISIGDLIARGNLVKPKTFKPQIGDIRHEVNNVKKTAIEYDMGAVAELMDQDVVTDEIIRHWKEKAGDRKTIIFCANTDHAEHVASAFQSAGVPSGYVHSNMEGSRSGVLKAFEKNEIQVLVNVMVLTEGFDDQTIGCVVILRPSAYRSTFIQIVGRGLRSVDPNLHPGFIKKDCIVLDFCTEHDSLEQDVESAIRQEAEEDEENKAPSKFCPECDSEVPISVRECPVCGFEFPRQESDRGEVEHVTLSEVDLLARSNFRWSDLFENDKTLFSTGFRAWSGVFNVRDDEWYAIGGTKDENGRNLAPRLLGVGDRTVCVSQAEDWISENETEDGAHKSKSWLRKPASPNQIEHLKRFNRWANPEGFNRYAASCRLSYIFNEPAIVNLVNRHSPKQAA